MLNFYFLGGKGEKKRKKRLMMTSKSCFPMSVFIGKKKNNKEKSGERGGERGRKWVAYPLSAQKGGEGG